MPIAEHKIEEFAISLGVKLPPKEEFWKLGDLTALRSDANGHFYRSNYERGMLLYALVARYRPKTVLEFGTGRGYGSLSMAWAMYEHQIDGCIYSVDILNDTTRIDWAIDWREGLGPQIEQRSWNEVWTKAVPSTWLKYIKLLNGDSSNVMQTHKLPPINMAFIDGGHDIEAVRHDFYATLQTVDSEFGILFDDYEETDKFGVSQLLAEEVVPYFQTNLLQTYRQNMDDGQQTPAIYQMAWVHSSSLQESFHKIYKMDKLKYFVQEYYRQKNPPKWKKLLSEARKRGGKLLKRLLPK